MVRVGQAEWWAEFKIFEDRDGSYYWQLQAASGRIIARSGHAYESKYWCEQDVNWLRANADQIMVYDHTKAQRRSPVINTLMPEAFTGNRGPSIGSTRTSVPKGVPAWFIISRT